jgi:hypothetical protein
VKYGKGIKDCTEIIWQVAKKVTIELGPDDNTEDETVAAGHAQSLWEPARCVIM